jgi:hypothetical protein
MQRFPDHSAQPSEERVTYANHRRTAASLRLPMSASRPTPAYETFKLSAMKRTLELVRVAPALDDAETHAITTPRWLRLRNIFTCWREQAQERSNQEVETQGHETGAPAK